MSETPTRRLFFALWPDAATRRAIEKTVRPAVKKAGGRPVVPRNYHITLVFLGAVVADRCDEVCAVARNIPYDAFDLTLDQFGYWPRPRILWLGSGTTPAALYALVESIWTAMVELGFERERRIFKPHVSLCRKLHKAPELAAPAPVVWPVSDFALVESDTDPRGARYTVVARFGQAHSVTH